MTLKPYFKHRRTILHIDLSAPPNERWVKPAEKVGDELQELLSEIVCIVQDGIASYGLPEPLHTIVTQLAHSASSTAGLIVAIVARIFGQEYPAEIKGLAAGADVPYTHALLANLMYDITQISESLGSIACSSYSLNHWGKPVLVRNMDWDIPDSIGRHTVMIEFHRGRNSYRSIGVVGLVGVLSAICTGKWAVTLNQAPVKQLGIRYMQTPALQRLRQACDRMTGFKGLVRQICQYQTMSPFFAHVVGTSPHEHVVISGLGKSYESRAFAATQYIVQTNHFVGTELDQFNPEGLLDNYDTADRYSAIIRRLKKGIPRSLKRAWDVMNERSITNAGTQQSMVLCPATGQLLLRVRVD